MEAARILKLQNYLKTYEAEIAQEGLSEQYVLVFECLKNLSDAKSSQAALKSKEAVKLISSFNIPKEAKTTDRVFKNVILKKLQNCFEISDKTIDVKLTIDDLPDELKVFILSFIFKPSSLLLTNKRWKALVEGEIERNFPLEMRNTFTYLGALADRYFFKGFEQHALKNKMISCNLEDEEMFGFAVRISSFPLMLKTFKNFKCEFVGEYLGGNFYTNSEKIEKYEDIIINQISSLYLFFVSNLEINLEHLDYCINNGDYSIALMEKLLFPLIFEGCNTKDHGNVIKLLKVLLKNQIELNWNYPLLRLYQSNCSLNLILNYISSFEKEMRDSLLCYYMKLILANKCLPEVVSIFLIPNELITEKIVTLKEQAYKILSEIISSTVDIQSLKLLPVDRMDLINKLTSKSQWHDAKRVAQLFLDESPEIYEESLKYIDHQITRLIYISSNVDDSGDDVSGCECYSDYEEN